MILASPFRPRARAVTVEPGPVYYFDGVTVSGTRQLRPSYLVNRFQDLRGKPYSPEALDKKFRELMRTSLFNILKINPTPVNGNQLRLDVNVEEAKPKEFGFSVGYGSYEGAILGASYANRDLFGYGRPITTSVEYTQRSYKGEILFDDPYLFNTGFALQARLSALTFDYDGYRSSSLVAGLTLSSADYRCLFHWLRLSARGMSRSPMLRSTIGSSATPTTSSTRSASHRRSTCARTRSSRRAALSSITPSTSRTSEIGSEIDLFRATGRVSYYLSFAPEQPQLIGEDLQKSSFQKWFERSLLAFGARAGIVYPLDTAGTTEALAIPIDERFFNGGSTTVRSFDERDLGPHDDQGNPIGGEYFTIFNVEYTFPIYGRFVRRGLCRCGKSLAGSQLARA